MGLDDIEVDVDVGEIVVDMGCGVVSVDDKGREIGVVTAATLVYKMSLL